MTFAAPARQKTFFFRVASGKEIETAGEGWKIDRLNLRMPGDQQAQVREGDPKELLIPLVLPKGETVIQLEYRW